jgi:hypothetical protein
MAEIVNLNRARKAKAKAAAEKVAANNRIKHGTPKHLRKLGEAERAKDTRDAEQRRLDKDQPEE